MSTKKFLTHLLNFESSINPNQYEWYKRNYHNQIIHSVSCVSPGRLRRDFDSGAPIFIKMTIAEYFNSIGIGEYFDRCDKHSFKDLRYRVINGWGFVGYQFGEALLITLGYYAPALEHVETQEGEKIVVPKYYRYTDQINCWREGITSYYTQIDNGQHMIVTDTNEWKGTFTGKDGIFDFSSLRMPRHQENIMQNALCYYLQQIIRAFGVKTLELHLQNLQTGNSRITLSGLLAASHLCGVGAVIDYLKHNYIKESSDELGTSLNEYLRIFSGYNVCFHKLLNLSTAT